MKYFFLYREAKNKEHKTWNKYIMFPWSTHVCHWELRIIYRFFLNPKNHIRQICNVKGFSWY